ncbi:stage II sporulation protein M [Methanothermococcus okinawensis]|uniref:Stage II sporulation protein M n=1 Tax=Methanothermococcus okinawensis (strain DSM 14208 / JCM 11175 / IH1) TaxID=647113 RepID=F8AL11_METOI|nr:protein of unknown function DUF95 transmembrane [Methanothermococcus okinawensis IH1]
MSLGIYLIGILFGFLSLPQSKFESVNIYQNILILKSSFCIILSNNLKVIFLMLAGAITFGFSTFINLIFNGFSLGMLISNAYNSGVPIKLILALILPHGIFEIPAMLISAVAGFKIPYEVIQYLRDKKEKPITEDDIKEFLKLALISIILIIIAAFVEVYITPKIANYLLT